MNLIGKIFSDKTFDDFSGLFETSKDELANNLTEIKHPEISGNFTEAKMQDSGNISVSFDFNISEFSKKNLNVNYFQKYLKYYKCFC